MEKKRRKWLTAIVRRTVAVFLCSAMVVTGMPGLSMDVKATSYGTLVNGNFSSNSDGWMLTGFEVHTDTWMAEGFDAYKNQPYLKVWAETETSISATQTIENMEPGIYRLCVNVGGPHDAGLASITVSSGDTTITTKEIPAGTGWGIWSDVSTDVFEITEENNDSVTISISGKVGIDSNNNAQSSEFDIDNVTIVSAYAIDFNFYNDIYSELAIVPWNMNGLSIDGTDTTWSVNDGNNTWNATNTYAMSAVSGLDNWFHSDFTIDSDSFNSNSNGIAVYGRSSESDTANLVMTIDPTSNNTAMYTALVSAVPLKCAIKNGVCYTSEDDITAVMSTSTVGSTIEELTVLLTKAQGIVEDNATSNRYNMDDDTWSTLGTEISTTTSFLTEHESTPKTAGEIKTRYNALNAALKAIVPNPIQNSFLKVERVAIDDDFITGADVSSYYALKQSGTVFKDAEGNVLTDQGFFDLLKAGGCNWIRIRVWNNPYDASGNGYGGGNNDVAKAVVMGKWATDAGMRVLIDFHYSDFWADPAKQAAPKAWKEYSREQKVAVVSAYTTESLNTLLDAGVDVGMVQVGNETNGHICGEGGEDNWADMAAIFNAGSAAIRQINTERETDILVALHFADPSSGKYGNYAKELYDNNVDYDVFASSYYPYWHGSIANLKNTLSTIATDYNKKVMVAETSWATTLDDGDGHENTVRDGANDEATGTNVFYDFSLQGQADEIHAVAEAMAETTGSIGMFYWEPAWISPNYVYNADYSVNTTLLNANKAQWESKGSGWASSYAGEYDPTDAGKWYGGSAVDNQAWFDFSGKALETVNIYKYIRYGAVNTSEVAVNYIKNRIKTSVVVGQEEINWDTIADGLVDVKFNDGVNRDVIYSFEWNEEDVAKVSTDRAGKYLIRGTVTVSYNTGEEPVVAKNETFNVFLTLNVIRSSSTNKLRNPGFEENTLDPWDRSEEATSISVTGEDPHSGNKGAHFWKEDGAITGEKIYQTVSELNAGLYTAGAYIQGGGAAEGDAQKLNVYVYGSNEQLKQTYSKTAYLSGWKAWQNPEISGIAVSDGDSIVFEIEINSSISGAWGTIDDCYLYSSYPVTIVESAGGAITLSDDAPTNEDILTITATPYSSYVLNKITITGKELGSIIDGGIRSDISGLEPEYVRGEEGADESLTFNYGQVSSAQALKIVVPDCALTVSSDYTYVGGYTPPVRNITGITVTPDTETVEKGKTVSLTASLLPSDANETATITWSSRSDAIATVTGNGKTATITGVQKGQTVITASVTGKNGTFTAECAVTVVDEVINVTGITVDPTTTKVVPDKTVSVTAALLPDTQNENPEVTWTSGNTGVATVAASENNLTATITGVKEGTASITASVTSRSGQSYTATCEVTVEAEKIEVTGFTIAPSSAKLQIEKTLTLIPSFEPADQTENPQITWTSDNTSVASVSDSMVTGVAEGEATITATVTTAKGETLTATCKITVVKELVEATGITVTPEIAAVEEYDTITLTAAVLPADQTECPVIMWSTSNPAVATVSQGGVVKGESAGTTTITATIIGTNGTFSDTCAVTVNPYEEKYYDGGGEGYTPDLDTGMTEFGGKFKATQSGATINLYDYTSTTVVYFTGGAVNPDDVTIQDAANSYFSIVEEARVGSGATSVVVGVNQDKVKTMENVKAAYQSKKVTFVLKNEGMDGETTCTIPLKVNKTPPAYKLTNKSAEIKKEDATIFQTTEKNGLFADESLEFAYVNNKKEASPRADVDISAEEGVLTLDLSNYKSGKTAGFIRVMSENWVSDCAAYVKYTINRKITSKVQSLKLYHNGVSKTSITLNSAEAFDGGQTYTLNAEISGGAKAEGLVCTNESDFSEIIDVSIIEDEVTITLKKTSSNDKCVLDIAAVKEGTTVAKTKFTVKTTDKAPKLKVKQKGKLDVVATDAYVYPSFSLTNYDAPFEVRLISDKLEYDAQNGLVKKDPRYKSPFSKGTIECKYVAYVPGTDTVIAESTVVKTSVAQGKLAATATQVSLDDLEESDGYRTSIVQAVYTYSRYDRNGKSVKAFMTFAGEGVTLSNLKSNHYITLSLGVDDDKGVVLVARGNKFKMGKNYSTNVSCQLTCNTNIKAVTAKIFAGAKLK